MSHRTMVLLSLGGFIAAVWFSLFVHLFWGLWEATFFVRELSQNIFWVCCLAIVALWVWKLRSNPCNLIANRLVNVLSVYFLLFLLDDGARQIAPRVACSFDLSWMIYPWLPIGSGFALVARDEPQAQ